MLAGAKKKIIIMIIKIILLLLFIGEVSYIFRQISVAIQRGSMLSFIGSFTTDTD